MASPTNAASVSHEMSTNVQVAVRCRPLNDREKTGGRPPVVVCKPNSNEISIVKRKSYQFDKVYGQYSTQKDVFKSTIKPVVDEALAGYNCTVFAYGQTGTGKTHTMQGNLQPDSEGAGIIPRVVRYIFDILQANHQEYSVKVSFLQLYNEELKDLLAPSESKKLRLMEDIKRGGIYCQNLLEVTTTTASHVFELLETGVKNRVTSETLMNENSSRSHSIFTIRIHSKEHNPVGGEDLLRIGQLNLVDLAGSECVGRSGARNIRAREAGNINQSLLTLGRVITALVDNHPHVPYRDSKLTRLLQESLGGRAKTTIIATLAPCADSIDETLSTLEYAYRAKNIKNKPEMNQKMTKSGLLKEYGSEIESLRNALQAARAKDGIFLPPAQFSEMQERLAGQSAQIAELEDELESRSKVCKELEEQVDLQKEEISGLQRDKVLLESTLREKETELEATKSELAVTKEELAETCRVLQLYQANEEVLLKNGGTATKLFRKSEQRVDQLLSKIQRKQLVETANQELANVFAEATQTQLHSFEERLSQHKDKQTTLFADVDTAMEEMRKAQSVDVSALLKTLEDLEAAMKERQTQADAELENERAVSDEQKKALELATENRQREMQQRLQEFVTLSKQSAQSLVEQLATTKQTQLAHLSDVSSNVSKSRDEMSAFLKEQSNKLAQLKSTLDASFQEQASQLAKHKQALVDALRDGQHQQKSHLVAMKTQLSQLIEQSIASHADRIDADVEMVTAHVDSHQVHLKSTQQIMAQEIDITTSGMDEAEALQQKQFQKFETRVAEACADVESMHKKQNDDVQTQQREREQWSETTKSIEQQQSEKFVELLASQSTSIEERLRSRAAAQQEFGVVHESFRGDLVEKSGSVESGLAAHAVGVKRKFEEVNEWATVVVSDSATSTTKHREQVESYIKKRRVDEPTGATPVKVSPPFPAFVGTNVNGSPVTSEPMVDEDETSEIGDENSEPPVAEPEAESELQEKSLKDDLKQSPSSETGSSEASTSSPRETESRTAQPGIPAPKQIAKVVVRKQALSGSHNQHRSFSGPSSSLAAPTKRFRVKKAPLSDPTSNKM